MRRIGFVRIVSNPTCFVAFPSTWLSSGSTWGVRAAEIEGLTTFVSASTVPSNDDLTVEFGSEFASSCGFREGDAIECVPWTGPMKVCDELTIVVGEECEYELVSLRRDFVEANLLSRLSVVSPKFPLWLGPDVGSVVVDVHAVGDFSSVPLKISNSTRLMVSPRIAAVPEETKVPRKRSVIFRAHEAPWSTSDVVVGGWRPHDSTPGISAVIRKYAGKAESSEKVRVLIAPETSLVNYPHIRIPRRICRALKICSTDRVELELFLDDRAEDDCLWPAIPPDSLPTIKGQFHLAIFDDLVDFVLKWLSSAALVPATNVLLHGPRKSGKSTLVRQLCSYFACSPFHVASETIDMADYLDRRPEALDARLNICVESVIWRRPAIIVIENMDASDSTTSEVETSSSGEKMAQLCRDWNKISGVLLLATSGSFESAKVHPFMKKMDVPARLSSDERRNFFTHLLPSQEKCNLEEFVTVTSGCSVTELIRCLNNARLTQSTAVNRNTIPDASSGGMMILLGSVEEAVAEVASTKATRLKSQDVAVQFDEVGGLEEAKKALIEAFVWPAKYPRLFTRCGLRMKRGVLLYGAPGSGKTLLGYAIAAEANLGLIRVKGPELLSKYIGQSEANVRDIFERAKAAAPCLLFFDEFDSLAPKRGHDSTGVSDRVVNQLLTALDGFEPLAEGVHVLAATSRPDLVDPALVRPGRFDRCIFCPFPDENARDKILEFLGSKTDVQGSQGRRQVAAKTSGFSGADLSALIHNARLKVVSGKQRGTTSKLSVSWQDVEAEISSTGPSLSAKVAADYQATFLRFQRPGDTSIGVIPSSRVSMA